MPSMGESLIVPWRRVAAGALLFALAAAAALAVVATVDDADALSTITLVVAIVALLSQLVIFAVFAWTSGEQVQRVEALDEQVIAMLAELRPRVAPVDEEGAVHRRRELLRLAERKLGAQEAKTGELDGDLAAAYGEIAAISAEDDAGTDPWVPVEPVQSVREVAESLRPLVEWPRPDDARAALDVLEALPAGSVFILALSVADDVDSRLAGTFSGLAYDEADEPLLAAGLLEQGPERRAPSGATVKTVVVTSHGRDVARILAAPWPPPPGVNGIADALRDLRTSSEAEDQLRRARALLR